MNQLPSKFQQWWPTVAHVVCVCGYLLFAGFVSNPEDAKSIGLPGMVATAMAHIFSTWRAKEIQNGCTNAMPPAEDDAAHTKRLISELWNHGHETDNAELKKAANDLSGGAK